MSTRGVTFALITNENSTLHGNVSRAQAKCKAFALAVYVTEKETESESYKDIAGPFF